jgi:hypothetical protein
MSVASLRGSFMPLVDAFDTSTLPGVGEVLVRGWYLDVQYRKRRSKPVGHQEA